MDCGCEQEATPLSQPAQPNGDRLNNPSLEPKGGDAQSHGVVIVSDQELSPETLMQIMQMVSGLADEADEAGLHDNATELDGILDRMAKVAQYEGFINYWLANGRAFERAWKIKHEKGKADDSRPNEYNSAQEAWMDVLEEYQEGLLGDHKDFLSKYASKCTECDKEVEEGQMGGSPTTTMSKNMTDWAKSMQEKAKNEGKTLGQIYSEWLDSRKASAANSIFMEKISSRLGAGSSPGVALYEALHELTSPTRHVGLARELVEAGAKLSKAASKAGNEELAKKAQVMRGFWDALTSPIKGWFGTAWHGLKDWWQGASASGGRSFELMRSMQRRLPNAVRDLEQLEAILESGSAVNPSAVAQAIGTIRGDLEAYHALVAPVVSLPPIPDPASPRYQSRVMSGMDYRGYEMFINDLNAVVTSVNKNNSLAYEKAKGQVAAQPPAQQAPEDVRLQKEFENLLDNLNNIVGQPVIPPQAFSKALGMHIPRMIDKAIEGIREPDDFMEYAAGIRDQVMDKIQRQISRSGVMAKMDPRERARITMFLENMKERTLKSIEKILRKRHGRKYNISIPTTKEVAK